MSETVNDCEKRGSQKAQTNELEGESGTVTDSGDKQQKSVDDEGLEQLKRLPRYERLNVVAGVKEDCTALLLLFSSKGSMRFQDFAECWKQMMFSHMLSGRTSEIEQMEYLQEMLKVMLALFVKNTEMIRKVGALYMLYGIYMKIPQEFKSDVFIRVSPASWAELLKVRDHARLNNHHDTLFVFYMLFHTGAFLFVAHDHQMGADLRWRFAFEDLSCSSAAGADLKGMDTNQLTGFLDDGGLRQLSTLHKKYETIKQQVFKGDRALPTLSEDPAQALEVRLRAVAEGRRPLDPPNHGKTHNKKADASKQAKENNAESILSAREAIRARAFSRYREPEPAAPASDAEHLQPDSEPAAPSLPSPKKVASPAKRRRGRGRGRGGTGRDGGGDASSGPPPRRSGRPTRSRGRPTKHHNSLNERRPNGRKPK